MTKTALIPIANGVEELEAVSIIDILRRAEVDVTVASIDEKTIVASRGVSINADVLLAEVTDKSFDLIALPGGLGAAKAFCDCEVLVNMLKEQASSGKLYGAICASPELVLATHGLIGEKKATCYTALANILATNPGLNQPVVVDGNLITSRGAGTALDFALELASQLRGPEVAQKIREGILA